MKKPSRNITEWGENNETRIQIAKSWLKIDEIKGVLEKIKRGAPGWQSG